MPLPRPLPLLDPIPPELELSKAVPLILPPELSEIVPLEPESSETVAFPLALESSDTVAFPLKISTLSVPLRSGVVEFPPLVEFPLLLSSITAVPLPMGRASENSVSMTYA